jgi:hypothetical protein
VITLPNKYSQVWGPSTDGSHAFGAMDRRFAIVFANLFPEQIRPDLLWDQKSQKSGVRKIYDAEF